MTSAQVKSMNTGLMEMIGSSNSKLSANSSIQDFSKMMQGKREKTDIDITSCKKNMESDRQPDSERVTSKIGNAKKIEQPVEKKAQAEDGKLQESMDEAVDEVKNEIAEILDISVEELEQVMGFLGFSDASLLDSSQLPLILAEITGEDILSILTNEELSNSLNDLMQMVNEKVESLAKEFHVLSEDIVEMANTQEKPEDVGNVVMLEIADPDEQKLDNTLFEKTFAKMEVSEKESNQEMSKDAKMMMSNESKEVTVEITNEDTSQNETKKDMSGKSDANMGDNKSLETNVSGMQNFAETIVENIEHAVNEITYTKESVDTEGIMKQIVNHVNIVIGKEVTSMELQLHPESLGKLDLQVALKDGRLVAEFRTENEAVKNVIESQMIQLKETLEAQGLKVASVEVSVAEQGLKQDMNQNSEKHGNFSESKRSGIRKINLQGINELEDIEFAQMDEEDQIATKMMLENGNTVDFTA